MRFLLVLFVLLHAVAGAPADSSSKRTTSAKSTTPVNTTPTSTTPKSTTPTTHMSSDVCSPISNVIEIPYVSTGSDSIVQEHPSTAWSTPKWPACSVTSSSSSTTPKTTPTTTPKSSASNQASGTSKSTPATTSNSDGHDKGSSRSAGTSKSAGGTGNTATSTSKSAGGTGKYPSTSNSKSAGGTGKSTANSNSVGGTGKSSGRNSKSTGTGGSSKSAGTGGSSKPYPTGTGSTKASTGTGSSKPYPTSTGTYGSTKPFSSGVGTSYSGTGKSSGTAFSTGASSKLTTGSSTTSSASVTSWEGDQCTGIANNNLADPEDRWNAADAGDAWTAAQTYAQQKSGSAPFSNLIGNFFGYSTFGECQDTEARSPCTNQECQTPAAGFLIVDSMASLSGLNYNTYDVLGKAQSSVNSYIGEFSSTFAPIEDTDETLKILLDLLALGFALTVSPLWNDAFKAIPFFKDRGNLLGTIKDWVNPIVSNGVTLIKDGGLSAAQINTANELSAQAGNIIGRWQSVISTYNTDLFNGSDSSNQLLTTQIQNGTVVGADFDSIDEPNVQNQVEKILFALLIPQAWSLSNEDVHPFILAANAPCGTSNPVNSDYLDSSVGDATYACGPDNQIYYLLQVTGQAEHCAGSAHGLPVCTNSKFTAPPGEDKLDGQSWGGLTRADLIISSVNTWIGNGKKNADSTPDYDDPNFLANIGSNIVQSAGVVSVPVCTTSQAADGWANGDPSDKFYPCDKV